MAASFSSSSLPAFSGATDDGAWDAAAGVWRGNRAVGSVEIPDPLIIFGYGSLCWRPEPSFGECAAYPCRVRGWGRFFAQRSTDHRGTPEKPGLVATMLSDSQLEAIGLRREGAPPSVTIGMGYEIAAANAEGVLADLDFREKGGYTRDVVMVEPLSGGAPMKALLYSATPDNPNFDRTMLDPDAAAAVIASAVGPSGQNAEYLSNLTQWLRSLDVDDLEEDGLMDLEARVNELQGGQ